MCASNQRLFCSSIYRFELVTTNSLFYFGRTTNGRLRTLLLTSESYLSAGKVRRVRSSRIFQRRPSTFDLASPTCASYDRAAIEPKTFYLSLHAKLVFCPSANVYDTLPTHDDYELSFLLRKNRDDISSLRRRTYSSSAQKLPD